MEITDFGNGASWLIRKPVLEEMIARLPDAMGKFPVEAKHFTEDPQNYGDMELRDGVAIIPIIGPISKRGSFYSSYYGGTNLAMLTRAINEAMEQPDVRAILLDIDSPGGTVAGTEAFGDLVWEAAKEIPIVSFANGMMASAAYWIGSAADRIVAEKAAYVGSIGTLMMHHDWSGNDEQMGLKRTILTAGKYKSVGNDAEPLSDLSRDTIQAELDYIYTLFVDTVARNRTTDSAKVLTDMADGRDFLGQQAVDVGLADTVGSLETALEIAQSLMESQKTTIFLPGASASTSKEVSMKNTITKPETVEALALALPELVTKIQADAIASVDTDAPVTIAIVGEQDRVLALVTAQLGEDLGAKFAAMVKAGATVEQITAIRDMNPEPAESGANATAVAEMLAKIQKDGVEGLGLDTPAPTGGKGFMVQVDEYVAVNKCARHIAMQAIMRTDPDSHKAFLAEANK